ncbi:DUF4291 family protein [Streptomyces sp. NPDC005921]
MAATHATSTITLHQAYSPQLGLPATRARRFAAAWRRDRMT